MKQIVNCRHLVVLIGVQALLSLLLLEAVLFEHADNRLFERDLVLPNDQTEIPNDRLVVLRIPAMLYYLLCRIPLFWIDIQNLVH